MKIHSHLPPDTAIWRHQGGLCWLRSGGLVEYQAALDYMEAHVAAIHRGEAGEQLWLLEHPPLYTTGTSAEAHEISPDASLPVYRAGRGGKTTWHGPGQRVVYTMLDLRQRGRDVRHFVWLLEEWIIHTLAQFGVKGERREGRVGIWVAGKGGEAKIAALGIRLRRWISFHGVSINLNPDLQHYQPIKSCGLEEVATTSLQALGIDIEMAALDDALATSFATIFKQSA